MSSNLHGTDYQIKIKQGTRSNLLITATSNTGVQGEPHYTTDTKQLFVHDGTRVQAIQTLDMALTYADEIISHEGNIIYNF